MRPSFRVVDSKQEHPRDIARRRVNEREQSKQPITNIHGPEDNPAPTLDVDEVLKQADPDLIGKKWNR